MQTSASETEIYPLHQGMKLQGSSERLHRLFLP